MINLRNAARLSLSILISVSLLSCIADPWPEPDSMENDNNAAPTGEGSGDTDGDGSYDYKGNGSDGDADSETRPDTDTWTGDETDTETNSGADSGEEHQDAGDDDESPRFENVFVSTPDENGFVTVVGLPGTVTPDSRVKALTDDAEFSITVGKDGGFADRIVASAGATVTLSVTSASGASANETVLTGDLDTQFPSGITAEDGQRRLTDSLISVSGNGMHLDGGYFVVGGNITRGTSGLATVICHTDSCQFSLILSAEPGDALDIFLVRNTGTLTTAAARTGTVAERLFAQ